MVKTSSFSVIVIIILSILLTSCVEHTDLNAKDVAIVNGYVIKIDAIEKKLKDFQLEKLLYEYDSFKNNIYPNLELLHLRGDLIDHVIHLLKSGNIQEARSFISSLEGDENGDALKYFLLKEFDHYEKLLNKQNNLIYAFEETLKDTILLQEAKKRSIIPPQTELEKLYDAYLCNIQEKMDANIYYKYLYDFTKSKEEELFQLDTEEAYTAYQIEKIKQNLLIETFKKEMGSHGLNVYLKNKLKESHIILNKKYGEYEKYFQS